MFYFMIILAVCVWCGIALHMLLGALCTAWSKNKPLSS